MIKHVVEFGDKRYVIPFLRYDYVYVMLPDLKIKRCCYCVTFERNRRLYLRFCKSGVFSVRDYAIPIQYLDMGLINIEREPVERNKTALLKRAFELLNMEEEE